MKCYKCNKIIDLMKKENCDMCGKDISHTKVHYLGGMYIVCKDCLKKLPLKFFDEVNAVFIKHIQPERLNPGDDDGRDNKNN